MIRDNLSTIRQNAFSQNVVITPRTNAPSIDNGQMFEDDVRTVLTKDTVKYIDGLCVPKVDYMTDMVQISELLQVVEEENELERNSLKVIP